MENIYQPFDVFSIQRDATSSSFVETILRSTPNSVVVFNSGSLLSTIDTASFAQDIVSASLESLTASLALRAFNADSASYLDPGVNIYLSQSFVVSDINSDFTSISRI